MRLIERLAQNKVTRVANEQGDAAVQPVARRGIQAVANTSASPSSTDPTEMYKGAIRPSQPSFDAERVKSILDQKDRAAEKSRVGTPGYTHVSTLCDDVCMRHYAINVIHDREDWEAVTGGHRLMWAFGRTAEAHIRKHLTTGDVFGFQVYGRWKCPCERSDHLGTRPDPKRTCKTCGHKLHRYFEEPWYDHENKIVGNPDLGVFIGRYFAPVEIKSMSKDLWDKLEAPLAQHVNQALLYRYLAEKAGLLVHDRVMLIYAKKEFKYGSPYKVYDVDVTTDRYVGMLNRSLELAASIRDSIERREPPLRLARCTSLDCQRAKKCPAAITCFNLPN